MDENKSLIEQLFDRFKREMSGNTDGDSSKTSVPVDTRSKLLASISPEEVNKKVNEILAKETGWDRVRQLAVVE